MYKIINLLFVLLILLFFFSVYNYYSSNKNIKNINLNRSSIDETLKNKISNLPVLDNDTNNVIEFNSSPSNEIKDDEQRNFWNLLKIK
mgnify:FL=1|tara:strand:+ start:966 stop:1229 length:264 start_codon:yes stop_codon:yes gene_type:complete